jgi:hypothetical protein
MYCLIFRSENLLCLCFRRLSCGSKQTGKNWTSDGRAALWSKAFSRVWDVSDTSDKHDGSHTGLCDYQILCQWPWPHRRQCCEVGTTSNVHVILSGGFRESTSVAASRDAARQFFVGVVDGRIDPGAGWPCFVMSLAGVCRTAALAQKLSAQPSKHKLDEEIQLQIAVLRLISSSQPIPTAEWDVVEFSFWSFSFTSVLICNMFSLAVL